MKRDIIILIITSFIVGGCEGVSLFKETNQTTVDTNISTKTPITKNKDKNNGDNNITIKTPIYFPNIDKNETNNTDSTDTNETNQTEENITIDTPIYTPIDSNETNDTTSTDTDEINQTDDNISDDNDTIITIDTTPPQIRLNGDNNISMLQGDIYNELGAVAEDNNKFIYVDIDGFVDSSNLGEYIVTYSATDEAGNSASISRTVLVEANRVSYRVVETIPKDWYIRIVAKELTREFKTENTQLGVLKEDNTPLKHSLKALAPFGSSYLDVVFIDPDGLPSGEYKSSFYDSSDSLDNVWNMRVKTDNASASIELSWRGLYILTSYVDGQNRTRYREKHSSSNPLIKYMKLIDITSGQEIPAIYDGKLQKYKFSMDGQTTKNFQWVVTSNIVDINISNITPPLSRRARVVGSPSNTQITIPVEPFDMFKVPKSDTFDKYTK